MDVTLFSIPTFSHELNDFYGRTLMRLHSIPTVDDANLIYPSHLIFIPVFFVSLVPCSGTLNI